MRKYRHQLPQLADAGHLFVTDAGLETTLIYHEGVALPLFAAFDLLRTDAGLTALRAYYTRYARLAQQYGCGLVLESPTWRANSDWARQLGYDIAALADANRIAIGLMLEIRAAFETARSRFVISGNLGPRGDGYVPGRRMSAAEARDYHCAQIATFEHTDADMVAAFTMNYPEEAIGIVQAARELRMPVAISFTLETDGRLPSGDTLRAAIERTDAETAAHCAYYMINCAHPTHFEPVLAESGAWRERLRGVRANASRRSHAELDASTDLDDGDPQEFGGQYLGLRRWLPGLSVVGGCCGTDHRHVECVLRALTAAPALA